MPDPKAPDTSPKDATSELFKQGLSLHQQGNFAQALEIYRKVLELQPVHFDALHLLGVVYLQLNEPKQAIDLIGRAIEINPGLPATHNHRGIALAGLMRCEEAVKSYDKAIALKPDYAEAYSNRGIALNGLKRHEEALQSCDGASLSSLTWLRPTTIAALP